MKGEEIIKLLPHDLKPNTLVEIEVEKGEYKGVYHSRIEEVREDTLVLAMPIKRRKVVLLPEGLQIIVGIVRGGISYSFESTILRRIRSHLPLLVINKPGEARKRQRRAWVRVPAVLDFSYALVNLEEADKELEFYRAQTLDISGGGLMFAADHSFSPGDRLKIILELPPGEKLRLEARVVRVVANPSEAWRRFSIGVEFTEIRERDRDRIVRWVFERQRELIKRGLL